MFDAKRLSVEQVERLRGLAQDGATIPDLQRVLKEEFGISVTYMDARFLVIDLGLELRPKEEPKQAEEAVVEEVLPEVTGTVRTSMDEIVLPGALISGRVTFSDGETATWMIDPSGRPGLDPDTLGYRPSVEDIRVFQSQLQELVREKRTAL